MIRIHKIERFWIFVLTVKLLLGEFVFFRVSTANVIKIVLQASAPI